MPGLGGYEVLAKIKGDLATHHVPVMMLSGVDDRAARMLGAQGGAADFLTKPLDRETLVSRVKNLLRKTYADYAEK
jgi:two-component system cell cycle response regulator